MDERTRSSGLDWTVVYSTGLNDDPARARSARTTARLPMKGVPYISRADVAAFLHRAAHGIAVLMSFLGTADPLGSEPLPSQYATSGVCY